MRDLIVAGIASFGHDPLTVPQVVDRILPEARQRWPHEPEEALRQRLRTEVNRFLWGQQPGVEEMKTILGQARAMGADDDDKIGDVLKRL